MSVVSESPDSVRTKESLAGKWQSRARRRGSPQQTPALTARQAALSSKEPVC